MNQPLVSVTKGHLPCKYCGRADVPLVFPQHIPPWAEHKAPKPWACIHCAWRDNPYLAQIKKAMNGAATPELIEAARQACHMSLVNTLVGAWMSVVLERLRLEHQRSNKPEDITDSNPMETFDPELN